MEREEAGRLMERFGEATGVTSEARPRRYLWTDAFAVCNWLGLGEEELARRLIGQVHEVLGRHRADDPREGWLSGLSEEEGRRRPTAGGLRIGKPFPDRSPDELYDPQLEWERDGQYFHYLTRWMRALSRSAGVTGDARYREWATELGLVAFDRFSHGIGPVPNRLYWKMSVDLSRPVVPSMGQHDPLDGYVVLSELRDGPGGRRAESLDGPIDALAGMADGLDWATEDPLGAGSLLTTAWSLARLLGPNQPERQRVFDRVMDAAVRSVREVRDSRFIDLPATQRLAFRELGMAIGLAAAERLGAAAGSLEVGDPAVARAEELAAAAPLGHEITAFWLDPRNRQASTWVEHDDINTVMLATAVHPDGYLD